VLEILREEIQRTLTLLGCAGIADLRPEHLVPAAHPLGWARDTGPLARATISPENDLPRG
jgi:hypothetical protein